MFSEFIIWFFFDATLTSGIFVFGNRKIVFQEFTVTTVEYAFTILRL